MSSGSRLEMEKPELTTAYYAVITDLRAQAAESLRLADDLEKRMALKLPPVLVADCEDLAERGRLTDPASEPKKEIVEKPAEVKPELPKVDKPKTAKKPPAAAGKAPQPEPVKAPTSSKMRLPLKPKEEQTIEDLVEPKVIEAAVLKYAREADYTFSGLIDEVLAEFPATSRMKISQAIFALERADKLRKNGRAPNGDPYVRIVSGGVIYIPDGKLSHIA